MRSIVKIISVFFSAEQIIHGNVVKVGEFYEVCEGGFGIAVFISDVRRLLDTKLTCNERLSITL